MTQATVQETIEQLQNKHNNVKVVSGVFMGMMMILYFFSYANLVDRGLTGLLYFEIITTLLFLLALVRLNQFAWLVLKLRFGNRPPFGPLLGSITPNNIGDKASDLCQLVQANDKTATES